MNLGESLEAAIDGDLEDMPDVTLDFKEDWEDPVESSHTDLEEVPEKATIEFHDGTKRKGWSNQFIIQRVMIDPEATVHPQT